MSLRIELLRLWHLITFIKNMKKAPLPLIKRFYSINGFDAKYATIRKDIHTLKQEFGLLIYLDPVEDYYYLNFEHTAHGPLPFDSSFKMLDRRLESSMPKRKIKKHNLCYQLNPHLLFHLFNNISVNEYPEFFTNHCGVHDFQFFPDKYTFSNATKNMEISFEDELNPDVAFSDEEFSFIDENELFFDLDDFIEKELGAPEHITDLDYLFSMECGNE
jgi:hypothetical protein